MGFIGNPKRVNTAFTRARECLIIVGNPSILAVDPSWNKIITWCKDKGNYVSGVTNPNTSKFQELDIEKMSQSIGEYSSVFFSNLKNTVTPTRR